MKRWRKIVVVLLTVGFAAGIFYWRSGQNAGIELDRYKGVAIYENGPIVARSFGRHFFVGRVLLGAKVAVRGVCEALL